MSFFSYLPNSLQVNASSLTPKTDQFSLEYQRTDSSWLEINTWSFIGQSLNGLVAHEAAREGDGVRQTEGYPP